MKKFLVLVANTVSLDSPGNGDHNHSIADCFKRLGIHAGQSSSIVTLRHSCLRSVGVLHVTPRCLRHGLAFNQATVEPEAALWGTELRCAGKGQTSANVLLLE
jgi:hypothetical protein